MGMPDGQYLVLYFIVTAQVPVFYLRINVQYGCCVLTRPLAEKYSYPNILFGPA